MKLKIIQLEIKKLKAEYFKQIRGFLRLKFNDFIINVILTFKKKYLNAGLNYDGKIKYY